MANGDRTITQEPANLGKVSRVGNALGIGSFVVTALALLSSPCTFGSWPMMTPLLTFVAFLMGVVGAAIGNEKAVSVIGLVFSLFMMFLFMFGAAITV